MSGEGAVAVGQTFAAESEVPWQGPRAAVSLNANQRGRPGSRTRVSNSTSQNGRHYIRGEDVVDGVQENEESLGSHHLSHPRTSSSGGGRRRQATINVADHFVLVYPNDSSRPHLTSAIDMAAGAGRPATNTLLRRFDIAKSRVERLWSETRIPDSERDYCRNSYFKPATFTNLAYLTCLAHRLITLRKRIIETLLAMEQYDRVWSRMQSQIQIDTKQMRQLSQGKKDELHQDFQALIQVYCGRCCDVVRAVNSCRALQTSPRPFIRGDQNVLTTVYQQVMQLHSCDMFMAQGFPLPGRCILIPPQYISVSPPSTVSARNKATKIRGAEGSFWVLMPEHMVNERLSFEAALVDETAILQHAEKQRGIALSKGFFYPTLQGMLQDTMAVAKMTAQMSKAMLLSSSGTSVGSVRPGESGLSLDEDSIRVNEEMQESGDVQFRDNRSLTNNHLQESSQTPVRERVLHTIRQVCGHMEPDGRLSLAECQAVLVSLDCDDALGELEQQLSRESDSERTGSPSFAHSDFVEFASGMVELTSAKSNEHMGDNSVYPSTTTSDGVVDFEGANATAEDIEDESNALDIIS